MSKKYKAPSYGEKKTFFSDWEDLMYPPSWLCSKKKKKKKIEVEYRI
jgi:hypothetical protein